VPRVALCEIHRSYEVVVDAGGKGMNVTLAVQNLGGKAICAGFLGGLSGQRMALLAEAEGFAPAWMQIANETHTYMIVCSADGWNQPYLPKMVPLFLQMSGVNSAWIYPLL